MILAILFILAVVAAGLVWRWQVPGRPLTSQQIDDYMAIISRQLPLPPSRSEGFIASLSEFAARDDGRPFYMLNLMRFQDQLLMRLEHAQTPKQANAYYEQHVIPLALKVGAYPVGAGMSPEPPALPGPIEAESWDRIIMMRYPSRRAFLDLLTDPAYAEFAPYKFASVELGLIPVTAQTGFFDLRWPMCAFALGLGLAAVATLLGR